MGNKSRTDRYSRRRKTNIVLNSLIGLIVIAIIVVAYSIISSPEEMVEDLAQTEENDQNISGSDTEKDMDSSKESGEAIESDESDEVESNTEEESIEEEPSEEDSMVVDTESNDPNVVETYTNSAWEPVGTEQSGEHVSIYDTTHIDWTEKLKAIAYATDLSQDSMTVWRIENGGSPQHSVGVVSSGSTIYRVYLAWQNDQGWIPEKVEVLETNPYN
ncbi:hypothetical protein Q73_09865 [Bacillus coahuilensis m2-6]|uniref:DUF1510 domain-containing protein n=1 Tax=Bacillus coahuilensis p1.1.43 TaxID=1150625 RepID=A0A147K6W3_9BACI|nr:YrrS family protein [Bacillus coahuilensis]KUP05805.1 hypothetical protein Q75_10455 [Bacillus coahuilensis p1.1.43]KUP07274.1 hypothetical protein Q73_09865 [Bacillus coahuilensis m2-6]